MSVSVAITVDVEFTIGGAFSAPYDRQPVGQESVELTIGNEGAGLEFILETLERNGLRGVFFVEVMNTFLFGDAPMGAIARRIHARGHDVQLHAHPCWSIFRHPDWRDRVRKSAPGDSLAGLADDEIGDVLQTGLDAFTRWGLPRPSAFRAGNLEIDRRIYRLLDRFGIRLASNVGLGAYCPREPELRIAGGRRWIDGVLEIPVSSYVDVGLPAGLRRWKNFTVVGTGSWEARQWLDSAARGRVDPVVILTHPAEFVHRAGNGYDHLHRNATARRRLEALCEFVGRRRRDFDVVTFADRLEDWTGRPGTASPRWGASPLARVMRVIENRMSASENA